MKCESIVFRTLEKAQQQNKGVGNCKETGEKQIKSVACPDNRVDYYIEKTDYQPIKN